MPAQKQAGEAGSGTVNLRPIYVPPANLTGVPQIGQMYNPVINVQDMQGRPIDYTNAPIQGPGLPQSYDYASLRDRVEAAMDPTSYNVPNGKMNEVDAMILLNARGLKVSGQKEKQWWLAQPTIAGNLLTSTMQEKTVDQLMQTIPSVHEWLAYHNEFGGVSGKLLSLRAAILQLPDPVARAQGLVEVEALAGLSKSDQQRFLTWATSQNTGIGGAINFNEPMPGQQVGLQTKAYDWAAQGQGLTGGNKGEGFVPYAETPQAQAVADRYQGAIDRGLHAVLGDQYASSQIGATGGDYIDLHARLGEQGYTAFQSQEARDHLYNIYSQGLKTQAEKDALRQEIDNGSMNFDQRLALYEAFPALKNANFGRVVTAHDVVQSDPWKVGLQVLNVGFAPFTLPLKGAITAASAGLRAVPGGTTIANAGGVGMRLMERGMNDAAGFLGRDLVGTPYRLLTGHDLGQSAQDFWGQAILAVGLSEASESLGDIKEQLSQPDYMTRPTAGLNDPMAFGRQGWRVAATHPWESFVHPFIEEAITRGIDSFHNMSLDSWVTRGAGKRFLSRAMDVADGATDQSVQGRIAALMQWNPILSRNIEWAKVIADSSNADEAAARTLELKPGSAMHDQFVAAHNNITAIEQKMADTQQALDGGAHGYGTVKLSADTARSLLEFPDRVTRAAGEGAGTAGPLTLEYDPATGKGLISEGMHRINAAEGDVTLNVKVVDTPTIEREGSMQPGQAAQELPQAIQDQIHAQLPKPDLSPELQRLADMSPREFLKHLDENGMLMNEANGIPRLTFEPRAWDAAHVQEVGTQLGNGVYRVPESGPVTLEGTQGTSYVHINDAGQVDGYFGFEVGPDGKMDPTTIEFGTSGGTTGIGDTIVQKVLADMGPQDFMDAVEQNAIPLSTKGALYVNKMLRSAVEPMQPNPELLGELQNLHAQRQIAMAEAEKFVGAPMPVWELPSRLNLRTFFHEVLYRPTGAFENFVRKVIEPGNTLKEAYNSLLGDTFNSSKQGWLQKFTDKLYDDTHLRYINDITNPGAKAAAADEQLTYLNRLFDRFGVSQAERDGIIGRVLAADTPQQFWDTVMHDIFGRSQDGPGLHILEKYMPKNIDPQVRDSILVRYGPEANSLHAQSTVLETLADGTTRKVPVLGKIQDGSWTSSPGAPSEFSKQIPMPGLNQLDEALSWWDRFQKQLLESNRIGSSAVSHAVGFGRGVMHASTGVLKPLVLASAIPAIILQKIFDETMGNALSPDMMTNVSTPANIHAVVGRMDPNIMGSALSAAKMTGEPAVMDITAARVLAQPDSYLADRAFGSLADNLIRLHDDMMWSQFARDGLDVQKMLGRFGQEGGTAAPVKFLQDHLQNNLQPMLDQNGMTLEQFLNRTRQMIIDQTFGRQDLLNFVAKGRVEAAPEMMVPPELTRQLANAQQDIQWLQEIDSEGLSEADHAAAQELLKQRLEEQARLQERAKAYGGDNAKAAIDRSSPNALKNQIKEWAVNRDIQLPSNISVKGSLRPEYGGVRNGLELANDIRKQVTEWAYGRGEVRDLADAGWRAKFSETFRNKLKTLIDERTTELQNLGMDPEQAARTAQAEVLGGRGQGFSFKRIGTAEAKWARGSFYEQHAFQFAQKWQALGWDQADALQFGRLMAANQARDMFYDLTARSTVERQLRNVFWFAPVTGELMYRWLYAIPAQSGGWLPGALVTAARVANWHNMLQNLGVIGRDPVTKQEVFMIPGLGNFVNHVTGGNLDLPDTVEMPVSSLFAHLSQSPGISTLPGLALQEFAKHNPEVQHMADILAPYENTTVVPSSIRNFFSMIGIKLPDLNPGAVDAQWGAVHDQALQYAYEKVGPAPDITSFYGKNGNLDQKEQAAYDKAWGSWFDQLNHEANNIARGLYGFKTLSSLALPGYLTYTSQAKEQYQQWFSKNILPSLTKGSQRTPAQNAMLDKWLVAHPESLAYSVYYNEYNGTPVDPTLLRTPDEQAAIKYAQSVKDTMNPQDYAQFLAAMTSKTYFDAKRGAIIDRIAPDGKASTILKNWGDYSSALFQARKDWNNYLMANPDANAVIDRHYANIAQAFGVPTSSVESQWITDTLDGLKTLANKFTGEDGLPSSDYSNVLGQLKQLNAKMFNQTGGVQSQASKDISWYFDNYLSDYFKKADALYAQADQLAAAGMPSGDVFSKLQDLQNKYSGVRHNGQEFPSIEQFFWSSKSPLQRKYAITHWQTEPLSYLTNFQREKAGYLSFKGENEMFDRFRSVDTQFYNFLKQNNVSSGSRQYDAAKAWQYNQKRQIANEYGPQGQLAFNLEQSAPIFRLSARGFGMQNDSFRNVVNMVATATSKLNAAGLSPSGASQAAIAQKQWVYNYIVNQERVDPQFKNIMQHLSFSTPPILGAKSHPTGAMLWEPIFFDTNPRYISSDLISLAPVGSI